MRRRVVITGVGAISAFGVGAVALWEGLAAGRSAIRKPTLFDPTGFGSHLMGEIPGFSAKEFVPKSYRKAVKVMARDTEIAVAAAKLAVDDAKLITRGTETVEGQPTTYPSVRVGCQIGAGLIAPDTAELASAMVTACRADAAPEQLQRTGGWDTKAWGTVDPGDASQMSGMGNLQPLWMLKYLPNMLACHVTIIHGAEGPSNTHTCAQASGLLSLGESTRVIERRVADCCFSGSAESKLNLAGTLRMALAGLLAPITEGQDPLDTVLPYDSASKGTCAGEGGGILILEAEEQAAARGARPYARVLGFGAAQSIGKLGEPNEGLADAIAAALRDSDLKAGDISVILPQGCGIPNIDRGEMGALRLIFGEKIPPMVTLVPTIGDCMAGNGGLQAAVGAMICRNGRIPADAAGSGGEQSVRYVLVCSSSQGGQNAALVFGAVS